MAVNKHETSGWIGTFLKVYLKYGTNEKIWELTEIFGNSGEI